MCALRCIARCPCVRPGKQNRTKVVRISASGSAALYTHNAHSPATTWSVHVARWYSHDRNVMPTLGSKVCAGVIRVNGPCVHIPPAAVAAPAPGVAWLGLGLGLHSLPKHLSVHLPVAMRLPGAGPHGVRVRVLISSPGVLVDVRNSLSAMIIPPPCGWGWGWGYVGVGVRVT